MARRHYASAATSTTISAGVNGSATTIAVLSVTGWPVLYPFVAIIDRDTASEEVVLVTAGGGLSLTVTRGYDSTTGLSHSIGATFTHGVSAIEFDEANAHVNATTNVHGTSGALVDAATAQALSNKDLTAGTNTFPTALVTTSTAQALTSKDLTSGTNTFPASLATDAGVETFTNKDMTSGTNTFPATLATLTGSQTLTNKTITGAAIIGSTLTTATLNGTIMSDFTSAQHDHSVASKGGLTTLGDPTWLAYTPVLDQNGAVTKTVDRARYCRIGNTVYGSVHLTVTGAGTGGIHFNVSCPVTPAYVGSGFTVAVGAGIFGRSSSSTQYGLTASLLSGAFVFQTQATAWGYMGLVGGVFTVAVGDLLNFNFSYEV